MYENKHRSVGLFSSLWHALLPQCQQYRASCTACCSPIMAKPLEEISQLSAKKSAAGVFACIPQICSYVVWKNRAPGVCVFVCEYIRVFMYIHICLYFILVHIYMYTFSMPLSRQRTITILPLNPASFDSNTIAHVRIYIYTEIFLHVYAWTYTHTHIYIYKYIYIYIYICIYTCIYVYTRTHIHTHIHTYT